jgi:CheY-like chemotaxis protein
MNRSAELNGPTVLVVDDEVGMRDTLVAILEHHGYRVWSAHDGETAFSATQQRTFDVLVMDIQMPGRDGVSVAQELGNPPPQVILMTAYAVEDRLRAAADAHVFAILSKPFELRRMLILIAQASVDKR